MVDDCERAMQLILQGAKDYGNSDFALGYAKAGRAVHLIHKCPDGSIKIGLSGAALSVRAWNERHLPQGDSMRDMTLAYGLLKRCIDDDDTPSTVVELCTSTANMDSQVTASW